MACGRSRWCERGRRIIVSALIVMGVGVTVGCSPVPDQTTNDSQATIQVPDVGLRPQDAIVDLAAVATPAGEILIAWIARLDRSDSGAVPDFQLQWSVGEESLAAWQSPQVLAHSTTRILAMAADAEGAHLVVQPGPRHFYRPAGDPVWKDRGKLSLPPRTVCAAGAVATASNGDPAHLFILCHPRTDGSTPAHAEVLAAAWTGDAWSEWGSVGSLAMDAGAAATLAACRSGNEGSQVIAAAGAVGRIFRWNPDMAGSPVQDLPMARSKAQGRIVGLAALTHADGCGLLVRERSAVRLLARDPDRTWRSVAVLGEHRLGHAITDATHSVTLLPTRGGVVAAWIDARHQRSDRKWWNPLGGVPWSDNPDWANNDLFYAPLDAVGSRSGTRRLTAVGGFVRAVVGVVMNEELILIWAGRNEVGHSVVGADDPPRVLISKLKI